MLPSQLPPSRPVIVDEDDPAASSHKSTPSHACNGHPLIIFEDEVITPSPATQSAQSPASTLQPTVSQQTVVHQTVVHQTVAQKSVGQHAKWRELKEQPLWIFFDKIREIHRAYPENEATAKLYHEIKKELFDRYLQDTLKQVSSYVSRKMPKFSLICEEDLQEAVEVRLWRYLDKFDPHFGTITFMQYFNAKGKNNPKSGLRGAIYDSLRKLQEFSRPIAQQRRELKPMFLELEQKLGHKPTLEEFLDEYGWETVVTFGKEKRKLRDIISNPLFSAGVFNQRQAISSLNEGLDDREIESLINYKARPAKNIHRMQSAENKAYILSLLEDEDMQFIVDCYIWQGDTSEKIRYYLNSFGQKCSLSWVATKYKQAKLILEQKLSRERLQAMIPDWEERGKS